MSGAFSFDGSETAGRLEGGVCRHCGEKLHAHDKERVYGEGGPVGSYHYEYIC